MVEKRKTRGDATRKTLIDTATRIFARDGFHAVSTRDIARAAGVNQALIGYHFRGKDGLYLAVFEQITANITARIGPIATEIETALNSAAIGKRGPKEQERWLALLLKLTDGMAALMLKEESTTWAQLIMREQQAPTAAFSVLFDGFMGPMMNLLTILVQRIRGDHDKNGARMTMLTIMGQVLVFRAARTGVLRHMKWTRVGDAQIAQIQAQVRTNVAAMLCAG